jgi:hypothetical protein
LYVFHTFKEDIMNGKTTVTLRVPNGILRKIDEERHRRTMQDAKGRTTSRTAIVLDALATSLAGKPGAAAGAVQ